MRSIFSFWRSISFALGFIAGVIVSMALVALPFLWHAVGVAKLIAVQSIGTLKRIYRESYATNGQSLDDRWRHY